MRKLIILLTAILAVTLCNSLNAVAYTVERGVGEEADVIIISGQAASAVTVTVLKAGTDKDAITTGEIYLTEMTQPDSTGTYLLKWLPLDDGEFDIYVSNGNGFERTENYFYFKEETKKNLLNILKTYTAEQMVEAEIFAKTINVRILEQDIILYETIENKDLIAKAICAIRDGLTPAETETIENYIAMALLQAAIQENSDANTTDALIAELAKVEDSFTLESFYQANIAKTGKAEVGEFLVKRLPLSLNELSGVCKDAMILAGINNEGNWAGVRKFMQLLEYESYDRYVNRDAIDKLLVKAVASKPMESIAELKSAVDKAIKSLNGSAGSSSGSSSGSSFGGSFSGAASAATDRKTIAEVNVNEIEGKKEPGENMVFSDVFESNWYYDAVNYLRWKGIVQGYMNNFYPQNNVTRAELVTMLKNAFGTEREEKKEISFSDVAAEDWFYADVTAAAKAGLVNGDGENFYPNDFVTRQDMAVMLKRFAENAGVFFESDVQTFEDEDTIADYAKDAILILAGNEIIQGTGDKRFEPLAHATRGEIAQVIYRIVYRD